MFNDGGGVTVCGGLLPVLVSILGDEEIGLWSELTVELPKKYHEITSLYNIRNQGRIFYKLCSF